MGEYDFDRLIRFKKVDVLQKALNDSNEHQRFNAVEALEAIALAYGKNDSAYNVLVDASTQSEWEDVRLHTKIALKILDNPQELIRKADERTSRSQSQERTKRSKLQRDSLYAENRLLCELDDECTTLIVRGSTLGARHKLGAIQNGRWDEDEKTWRFPINREAIESLKNGGVVLHPTVRCLWTSSQDTWALGTRSKKWIKVVGNTEIIDAHVRQVPGSQWDSFEGAWRIPFSADSIKRLIKIESLYVSPFILD